MTEAEWLASADPERMYDVVAETLFCVRWPHHAKTSRRRTLFGAACCRLVWPWVAADERCRRVVEYSERQFDGPAPGVDTEELYLGAKYAAEQPGDGTPDLQQLAANRVYGSDDPGAAIGYVVRGFEAWLTREERARLVADLMRDVLGNRFRPVAVDPSWLTPTVVAIARGKYDSRDFSAMPILADALQVSGCDSGDILDHCREDGPHVRGCWVVDAVLNKERWATTESTAGPTRPSGGSVAPNNDAGRWGMDLPAHPDPAFSPRGRPSAGPPRSPGQRCGGATSRMAAPRSSDSTRMAKRSMACRSGVLTLA